MLEYVEGGSLAANVKKYGPLSERLVARQVRQVLNGLTYLHSQGIVHRDIKGANILLTKDGQIKLSDFGVATKFSETVKSMSFAGSPYWMAPEIIESGHCSAASDIWSLACTIYELITGNPPYSDLNPLTAMYRLVQDDRPPLPRQVTPQLDDFLSACFRKTPSLRPSATDLLSFSYVQDDSIVRDTEMESGSDEEKSHRRSVALLEASLVIAETSKEDSGPELAPPDRVKNVRSLLSKSTRVTSQDLASPRHQPSLSVEHPHLSEIRETVELMKESPQAKEGILERLSRVKEDLEGLEDPAAELQTLQLLNQAVDNDREAVLLMAVSGMLPVLFRYSERHYQHALRVEASYLMSQMTRLGTDTVKLFLAAGGADRVTCLLDVTEYDTDKDLLMCGLDCMYQVCSYDQVLATWTRGGALERVLAALESLLCDPDDLVRGHMLTAAQLIEKFGMGTVIALHRLSSLENLDLACSMLPMLSSDMTLCFVRTFNRMCERPTLHIHLENAGMVPTLVALLQRSNEESEEFGLLVTALASLCRLSPARLEQAALADVAPVLLSLLERNTHVEAALPLALGLVTASRVARNKLKQSKGLDVLFSYLESKHRDRVVETIASWVWAEGKETVWKDSYTSALVRLFVTASDSLDLAIECFVRITQSCEAFALAVTQQSAFTIRLRELLSRPQAVQIEKKLLELVMQLVTRETPRAILERLGLKTLLSEVRERAKREALVVVDEYLDMLQAAYSAVP